MSKTAPGSRALEPRYADRTQKTLEPRYQDMPRSLKAAVLTYLFSIGQELSTADIQQIFGYKTWQGAYWLVTHLSGAIPIVKEDQWDGRWRLMSMDKEPH